MERTSGEQVVTASRRIALTMKNVGNAHLGPRLISDILQTLLDGRELSFEAQDEG